LFEREETKMAGWSVRDIPSQKGKIAVITGATGGLGLETALALAGAGAEVVVTGRNPDKGAAALRTIRSAHPSANVSYESLDTSSLAAVRAFTDRFAAETDKLDILVNNAGVMALPERQETVDGFELQFGTNHLGHFALTAQLLPLLSAARGRVVSLASIAARNGAIHFDDLNAQNGYRAWEAYGQSKLACLMFGLELQRRSTAGGWGITSVVAHPGVSSTNLIENGMGAQSLSARFKPLLGMFFQSPAEGALPQLYAATMPGVVPGGYYGPDGFMELRGKPKLVTPVARARDESAAARLWDISERLTAQPFPQLRVAA
jgi:NAD(P)-dependent dehydrogenase (short-subunit alcohol dehydrogenase family)